MKKTIIILAVISLLLPAQAARKVKQSQQTDRDYWCSLAYKMAQPVLENMARGELQKNMKTEFSPSFDNRDRSVVYMETFGRLMAGIAPWLTLPDDDTPEGLQRRQLRQWALAAYKNSVDPNSPDYLRQIISVGVEQGRIWWMLPILPNRSFVPGTRCGSRSMMLPNSVISRSSKVCVR